MGVVNLVPFSSIRNNFYTLGCYATNSHQIHCFRCFPSLQMKLFNANMQITFSLLQLQISFLTLNCPTGTCDSSPPLVSPFLSLLHYNRDHSWYQSLRFIVRERSADPCLDHRPRIMISEENRCALIEMLYNSCYTEGNSNCYDSLQQQQQEITLFRAGDMAHATEVLHSKQEA